MVRCRGLAVERGDDGYGKRWGPFLAVVYDVVYYYCNLAGPPIPTCSKSGYIMVFLLMVVFIGRPAA